MKKILVFLVAVIASATVMANQNADSTFIVSKDTIKANNITLTTQTSKAGKEYTKAVYMGRKYSISKADIDRFDPNKTYIIYNVYNNNERKISKVIIK